MSPISGAHQNGARNKPSVSMTPNAVKIGHQDGGGMCIGSTSPKAVASTCSRSSHSGSRVCTVGMVLKLYSTGGEVVAHSRVGAPHGLLDAFAPRFRLHTMLASRIRIATNWMPPPIE